MMILAIDTSTRSAGIALLKDEDVVAESFFRLRVTHSERVLPAVEAILSAAGTAVEEVRLFAVTHGPGSFTGLRVGAGLAKGMALGTGGDIIGVSTLDALAQNLADLANTVVQLRRDFSAPNDIVLVLSEFGRTSAENGTRGTDHGHGNALWVMGNGVQGGRWHGQWQGLAQPHLHEGRDLPVHHDFRAVLAQVLHRNQGLDHAALQGLFPGYAWDPALDALMHT